MDVYEIPDIPPLPFDKHKWVGRGKKYPTEVNQVPPELGFYCKSLLAIPHNIQETDFPSDKSSVKLFLVRQLPEQSKWLPTLKPAQCFESIEPNDDGTSLVSRQLPSDEWIKGAYKHFGQAILDGRESILDPAYPGSRLPFWTISWWKEMSELRRVQQTWRKALVWVEKNLQVTTGSSQQLMQRAQYLSENLRWREQVLLPGADGSQTFTDNLTTFLSDNEL